MTDDELLNLWHDLEDVPIDEETETLLFDWFIFPKGTDKEEIWHWFDGRYSKGVYSLLYCGGE